MSVRNFEEYRAEVLEALGATAEDIRNEASWRAKVLEALGAEYTDEDTRNFERYRLKVLENLSGGGGGGSSDFSTAEVTVVGNEQNQVIMDGAVAQTFPSGSPITAGTTFSFSTTADVVLYKGTAVIQINNPFGKTVSVSGSIQNMGATAYIITGDCTITIS